MSNPMSSYASFLLRLSAVQTKGQRAWVASLESTATGERRVFSNVGALIQFFQTEFGEASGACQPEGLTHSAPEDDAARRNR